jgi:hypothetical protein
MGIEEIKRCVEDVLSGEKLISRLAITQILLVLKKNKISSMLA